MTSDNLDPENDTTNNIIQNFSPDLTARVCVSFSMQRNLGNYESAHYSIRYEQNCRPEDRQELTNILEREALAYIQKRSAKVDEYIRKRDEAKAKSQTQ